jgi:NAD-dependent SIR2 family protein deacetylase
MSNLRSFDIFLCHKKSSGKDFADHLKRGLEEMGYHTFLDSKDIPKMTDGQEEWIQIRDQALSECKVFILLITPGFNLSAEVLNEIRIAREIGGKRFLYFRHRDLGRKIIIDLQQEKVDLGRQEQVSFETKEELLRLADGILKQEANFSKSVDFNMRGPSSTGTSHKKIIPQIKKSTCEMCERSITEQPFIEVIDDREHIFDCEECAKTYKKLKRVYGETFQ